MATKKTKPAAAIMSEVASALLGERQLFVDEVAKARDEILALHGNGDLALYERILRDDKVKSAWQQRQTAVTSMPWSVDAGGDKTPLDVAAADHLREQLNRIQWDRITEKMLFGIFYGYAVGECLYKTDGKYIELADIKVRRTNRFRFGREGELLLRVDGKAIPMPPQKFWVYTCGGDDDDDWYGRGLGHWLYWPVFFKRNAIRFWSLWLEKLAAPTSVARSGPGASASDERKLMSILDAITNGGKIVIPKSVEVSLLEAARNSGGDYDVFVQKMNTSITQILLSQTMTSDDGASLSQALVHARTKGAVVRSDADLGCSSFCAGPGTWLTQWNFPGAATPVVYRNGEEPEDLLQLAQRDQAIFATGYRRTAKSVKEVYGDGYELVPGPVQPEALAPGPSSEGASAPSSAPTIALAPTDLVKIVTVNEGRRAQGLGDLVRADGAPDPDGNLSIAEYSARREAQSAAVGQAVGQAQGAAVAATTPVTGAAPKEPAEFAEEIAAATTSIDAILDGDGWERVIGPEVAALEDLLKDAKTLEEVRARLGELATRDPKQLAESLARVMFAGRIAGGAGAEPDDAEAEHTDDG